MLILGLESSCDETAAAVVEDGRRVLSNIISSQDEVHAEYAGVVPELASRAHVERILPAARAALEEAGVGLGLIDAVAVGHRPGLIGCLLVAVTAAKALSWSLSRPLVGVDHVLAHLYAARLSRDADVPFPAIGLVASGGHTSLYLLHDWARLELLGATIDDAMGEAFDKAATILGLGFPGGPALDRLASSPGANENFHRFPVSRLSPTSLDFSFSGLKTAMLYAVRGVPGDRQPPQRTLADVPPDERAHLAASFRRAACDAAVLKLERAFDHAGSARGLAPRALVVGGGVSANSLLRRELADLASRRGVELVIPDLALCVDNAAMVAGYAHELARRGLAADLSLRAQPRSLTPRSPASP